MPKKKKKKSGGVSTPVLVLFILLDVLLIAGAAVAFYLCLNIVKNPPEVRPNPDRVVIETTAPATEPETEPEPTETEPPTTMPEPEHVVSTATIATTGDVLMHLPVIQSGQSGGSYNFDSILTYLKEYTSAADLAAANLEVTLAGTDLGYSYQGYPHFNCPDAIVDNMKDAGFDMLLTANNHSYDTGLAGYKRTLEVVRDKGLMTLGTYLAPEEQKWTIVEVNGIKVGMLCYTWAFSVTGDGRPSLNGNAAISEAGLCNYFYSGTLPSFYTEVEGYLAEMKEQGAEATMMFIHWGQEYQLTANSEQQAIAQKLCDLGIDVIVGGHPHVIQPVSLLTSTTDETHKTVCLYSTGNMVSNQRLGNLSAINTAHTEDGILFSVTFSKYSDGTVYLEGAEALPCWVNMRSGNGGRLYPILPLDMETKDSWKEKYDLNDSMFASCEKSYDRTMKIVGEGLTEAQEYLAQAKADREAAYLAAVTAQAA